MNIDLNTIIPTLIIIATFLSSYFAFNNSLLFQKYLFQVGAILRQKQYYRLISSGFLHANWTHLFFNMLTLYFFYRVIVYLYGVWLFLILYFGAMLAGNLFSLWLYRNRPSYAAIGASGAVSGIIFAAIAINPLSSIYLFFIPIPIPAWMFATVYFAYSAWMMLNPKAWDNLGHAAHLGGAILGMIFVAILTPFFITKNAIFIGIMCLPLLYLAFELFIHKRIK